MAEKEEQKKIESAKEILLPGKVKVDLVKASYKNGILEIVLEKEK